MLVRSECTARCFHLANMVEDKYICQDFTISIKFLGQWLDFWLKMYRRWFHYHCHVFWKFHDDSLPIISWTKLQTKKHSRPKLITRLLFLGEVITFSTSSSNAHCTPSFVFALASMNSMWYFRANRRPSSRVTSRRSCVVNIKRLMTLANHHRHHHHNHMFL